MKKQLPKKLSKAANQKQNPQTTKWLRRYVIISLLALSITCLTWAVLSATIQQRNADQLVNTYMFENTRTFHTAIFPSSHTFLIKWPLFLVIKMAGASNLAFMIFTVALCLFTVGALVAILYRINSRPMVFGTLCLCLASVLLLVPPAPYAGGLLPVNMAMLATRNIEYVVYMFGLYMLVKSSRWKSRYFIAGVISLTLLGASDKLFLIMGTGGAVMLVFTSFVMRRWSLFKLAVRWTLASLASIAGTIFLLWLIKQSGLTHLSQQTSGSIPYGIARSLKDVALGLVFGVLGIVTNFGVNPAYDAQVLRKIPFLAQQRLMSPAVMAYIVNAAVFVGSLYASCRVFITTIYRPKIKKPLPDAPYKFSSMLALSSLAAFGAFVFSDHYYVVDARYLTIVLFAAFVGLATYLRQKVIKPSKLVIGFLAVVMLGIFGGLYGTVTTYHHQRAALADINDRNARVAQSLIHHPVATLVGDYWRVLPVKNLQSQTINVMPTDDCTLPRQTLTSGSWQIDLTTHSFAYLLSFDKSLTNFPACKLQDVIAAYGRPNSSALIAGSLDKPQEFLLFYDQGAHRNPSNLNTQTVLPIAPAELVSNTCDNKPVILNFVAHQDDDLLFLSPDLWREVQDQDCVRTVYMTAGDAGFDKLYWQARERGSEAAYSKMLHTDDVWIQKTVKLSDGHFVTVASPRGNPKISLLFMRLPDGSPAGLGFNVSRHESLERLQGGQVTQLSSVDGQSVYSSEALADSLVTIMQIYQPTEIHTQSFVNASETYPDHSDHLTVGRFVQHAHEKYDEPNTIPVTYYIGYPIKTMPPNLSEADINLKMMAFFAYAQYDGSVCHTMQECGTLASYGAYLRRQYGTTSP